MTAYIWLLLFMHAPHYGIDPKLAAAVIKTESNFNPKAIGNIGEVGLFQIRPEFSKYSRQELMDPEVNVLEGLKMMKVAKKHCPHREGKQFVICHNVGLTGAARIKHPTLWPYYKKVYATYQVYRSKI
jgi:hypothetical protein